VKKTVAKSRAKKIGTSARVSNQTQASETKMSVGSQRIVRSLTLADHDQVREICKDVYGGLDQTPHLFPALITNPKTHSHVVVDENNHLLGFQLIDVIDEGRTAWFHTLRVWFFVSICLLCP
jgi:hypothetical protein